MWPDKDSPFWPILRVTLRQGTLLLCLLFMYRSGLAPADAKTMLLCILADAGLTGIAYKQNHTDAK